MKQLIKKLIPRPVLHMMRDIHDKRRLRVVPELTFDTVHLRHARDLDLPAIFSDVETENTWNSDNETIAALFGDGRTSGGINPGDRRALYYLITALKPERVLEVGTHIGMSTLYISNALKHLSSEAQVTTIDILDVNEEQAPWKNLGLEMSPRAFADKLGCLQHINFKASPALSFMKETTEKFDLIFLDGDHSSQAVYKEISVGLARLKPRGLILLHDYYPEAKPLISNGNVIAGPFRALDRIEKEGGDIRVQPLGALPWPTKMGSNVTSLAVVLKK